LLDRVLASRNGGVTWQPVGNNLGDRVVHDLIVDPFDNQTI